MLSMWWDWKGLLWVNNNEQIKYIYIYILHFLDYLLSHGYDFNMMGGLRGYLHEKNDFSQVSKNFQIWMIFLGKFLDTWI